jgi:hypothetical protein
MMTQYEAYGGEGDGPRQGGPTFRVSMAGLDVNSSRRSYQLSEQRACLYLL